MDGIFGKRFDLNGDGHMSVPEHMADFSVFSHFMDEIDSEGAEEAKAGRYGDDDLGFCDTSDTFMAKDSTVATAGDFFLDDRKYYANLFADVDNMDELDDDDEFEDEGDYRDDDLDEGYREYDPDEDDYLDDDGFVDDYREDDDGFDF